MPAADVALGAIAARTSRIRLGSAVTVLSSDDPVRVFQRYSTLDAVSSGRAEVILGRGSSIESFPLFGYDLADYERLFDEKTSLFAELLKGGPVTWEGTTRAALRNQDVVPHTEFRPFPTWIGVGGSPESVLRAARHGFSLMLAIIGGPPARFAPFSRRARIRTADQGVVHGRRRARGSALVGSPDTVAQKIVANLRTLDASRFDLKFGMPGLSQQAVITNIELYGKQVIPRVRELWAEREPEPSSAGGETS